MNTHICRQCGHEIPAERQLGGQGYCACGWYGPLVRPSVPVSDRLARIGVWVLVAVFAVGVLIALTDFMNYGRMGGNRFALRLKAISGADTTEDWRVFGVMCLTLRQSRCAEEAFQHVVGREPDSHEAWEALGLAQVDQNRFGSAVANFERVFASGQGTARGMAGMGRALEGEGDVEGAKRWYARALSANPALLNVAERWINLLVNEQRYSEALSLIGSLIDRDPRARERLAPRLYVIGDRVEVQSDGELELRLASVNGHHFVPVRMAGMHKPELFMVDTGASVMQVSWSFLQSNPADEWQHLGETTAELADGSTTRADMVLLKRVQLGPVMLTDVVATVCVSCRLLVGQSVLKSFGMSTRREDGVDYMTLTYRQGPR